MHLNDTVQIEFDNESCRYNSDLCECSLNNNEASILCVRCSQYSSSTTGRDQLDTQNYELMETVSTTILHESEHFTNCIEESFIDHKLNCSPDQRNDSINENNSSPILADDVIIHQNAHESTSFWDNEKAEVKVHLPWDKIFNLTETNTVGGQDLTMLELGPAKIEVRGKNLWNGTCTTSDKNSSPFVKVKRLVVQRADSMEEVIKHNEKIEEIDISGTEETVVTTTIESENEEQVDEEIEDSTVDINTDNAEETDLSGGIPRMVIKKTNCREYKSYLRMDANIHPVVRLYKSRSLDELARKYFDENCILSESTPLRSYPKVERSLTDCDTRFWRWQEKKNDQLRGSVDRTSDAEHTDRIHEEQSETQLTASDIGEELKEDHDVKLKVRFKTCISHVIPQFTNISKERTVL